MLLNIIRKIKYLTDQFKCVFIFALATLNSYIYFCYPRQLATARATYAIKYILKNTSYRTECFF